MEPGPDGCPPVTTHGHIIHSRKQQMWPALAETPHAFSTGSMSACIFPGGISWAHRIPAHETARHVQCRRCSVCCQLYVSAGSA